MQCVGDVRGGGGVGVEDRESREEGLREGQRSERRDLGRYANPIEAILLGCLSGEFSILCLCCFLVEFEFDRR